MMANDRTLDTDRMLADLDALMIREEELLWCIGRIMRRIAPDRIVSREELAIATDLMPDLESVGLVARVEGIDNYEATAEGAKATRYAAQTFADFSREDDDAEETEGNPIPLLSKTNPFAEGTETNG